MKEVTTIGLDLAKSVFQVHGVDASGKPVIRRQLRRRQVLAFFKKLPPCLVGMEACASSHYWAREIAALGHEVRMMPARYVKPYVKRNKSDAADAEAICEAVTRPTMRFVPIKTPEQQAVLMLHRTRALFVRQRTALINALRAHLAEFGIVAGVGRNGLGKLLEVIADERDERVPPAARDSLLALRDQLVMARQQILEADRRILAWHRASEVSRRLAEIPGVGPLIATALVARSLRLSIGARPVGLDRAGAKGGLHRRQASPWAHLQGGRPLSAKASRNWRTLRDQARQAGRRDPKSLACRAHGAPPNQDRSDRAGQQDRPHRLGHHGPRDPLPRASAAGGLRHARALARAHEVGKGK
jgi:transposase